jgi:hypothetical protein
MVTKSEQKYKIGQVVLYTTPLFSGYSKRALAMVTQDSPTGMDYEIQSSELLLCWKWVKSWELEPITGEEAMLWKLEN